MVHTITVGPFQENCHLLAHQGELAIFDPGDEAERLAAAIDAIAAKPRYILLTHAHLDHVGAVAALQARYGVPVVMHRAEGPLLENLPLQCQLFGLAPIAAPAIDQWLEGHEALPFASGTIQAMPTPGHSPGGTSFRFEDHVFVGDTIFAGGVGRTDLWGGSWPVLESAIRDRLFTLPEHLTLYPGHGPLTTVGEEKRSNPFFN